jgi:hypothetical protein
MVDMKGMAALWRAQRQKVVGMDTVAVMMSATTEKGCFRFTAVSPFAVSPEDALLKVVQEGLDPGEAQRLWSGQRDPGVGGAGGEAAWHKAIRGHGVCVLYLLAGGGDRP